MTSLRLLLGRIASQALFDILRESLRYSGLLYVSQSNLKILDSIILHLFTDF